MKKLGKGGERKREKQKKEERKRKDAAVELRKHSVSLVTMLSSKREEGRHLYDKDQEPHPRMVGYPIFFFFFFFFSPVANFLFINLEISDIEWK